MNIKKLLLLVVLCYAVSFLAKSQNMPRWIGDNAIMGKYEIVNRGGSKYYRLYDVHTKGITIGEKRSEYDGHLEDDESIRFSFTDTDIPCDGKVRFYKYNMDIEDWQVDGEIRVGQKSFNTTSSMVVMLVLDCSSSMDNDFEEMRRSAKDFVRQLGQNSIGSGNIHMGLICFNSVKFTDGHTYEIRPIMNTNDVDYFCNKIDQLNMGNNTAMYYAMDKGYDMINDYVNSHNLTNYKSACMVTFTDGYDNHSIYRNEKPQSGVNNPYYKHINDIIRNKTIKNYKVESFVIALKGSDVKEIEQANPKFSSVFEAVLRGVASDDNEFPRKVRHFTLCENMSAVKRVFNEICESLIYSWQVLNCYCAQSHDGWVQWVVECEEVHRPIPPDDDPPTRTTRSPWFGISAEVGALRLDDIEYAKAFGGVNLDMAFSINNTFAVGGRLGVMFGEYWDGYYYYGEHRMGILVGPEVKITFPNNSAVFAGIGGGSVCGDGVFFLRAGYKTRKSFFLTTELLTEGNDVGFGFGLGFSFGGKIRK